MPIYEFHCATCDRDVAHTTTVAERPQAPPCPTCQTPMERIYRPLGFSLKGSGWTPKASL